MRYIVIGAGIIGTSVARELAIRGNGKITVLEKEDYSGAHASGRNSGVIHSGINQKPGTLKAKLCVEGSKLLRDYCFQNKIPINQCGTVVVANKDDEIQRLRELQNYAELCNVPETRIINQDGLKRIEPMAKGLEAIFSPTGSIVDSKALLSSLIDNSKLKGVEFKFGTKVERIKEDYIKTNKGHEGFDFLINCSGLHADNLAHTVGVGLGYSIIPFRGDYKEVGADVNGMIYHVPDLRFPFLGVHLTKTIDERVIAGPTATLSFSGREGYDGGFNMKFFSETANSPTWGLRTLFSPSTIWQIAHNIKISIREDAFLEDIRQIYKGNLHLINKGAYRSGIRPQIVDRNGNLINDFLLERYQNQLHVLNAVSPGLTSSLAFAKYLADNYISD